MRVAYAKNYIRRVRTDISLRQKFERVWQGKFRQPEDIFLTNDPPIIAPLLAATAPDQKVDMEGYRTWWWLYNAQRDIHALLFSKGDGSDHGQRYTNDEGFVDDMTTMKVLNEEHMQQALEFLAKIANASLGLDIGLADMRIAWHHYVRWIYQMTYYASRHEEVQRLRANCMNDKILEQSINTFIPTYSLGLGLALSLQNYLETGFAHEEALPRLEEYRAKLEFLSAKAVEKGYQFSGLDYLRDCINRQSMEDKGPKADDKYWPEDDPNRWNYEAPPVRFSVI